MSLGKSSELWKSVVSIENVPAEDRLQYLMELPPGGIHCALSDIQDWFNRFTGVERMLVVAMRSLSKVECDTDCEAARYETRETIEAILEEFVDWLNDVTAAMDFGPLALKVARLRMMDCGESAGRQLQMDITALGGGPEDGGFDPELCGFGDC